GDAEMTGLGIVGFEPESGHFTSVWIDSRQTKMSLRQSKDKFDGELIRLHSKSVGGEDKDARVSVTETRLAEDGQKIVHRQYNVVQGDNGKSRLVMELILTRKGKALGAP